MQFFSIPETKRDGDMKDGGSGNEADKPKPISLKDIPPLDPSSIPPLRPRTMTEPVNVAKVNEVEEDNVRSLSNSNSQIDFNSTSSVNIKQEKKKTLVPKPEEKSKDESKKGSAKLVLHEICISKRWKPPVYECCKVDGPCHMRLFTYKTVVEIRDSSGISVLECFGDPKRSKKAAAQHAAEAALWYLEHSRQYQTKLHQ